MRNEALASDTFGAQAIYAHVFVMSRIYFGVRPPRPAKGAAAFGPVRCPHTADRASGEGYSSRHEPSPAPNHS